MVRTLIERPASWIRDVIARSLLGGDERAPTRVGQIILRPHQRSAVARLRTLLNEMGGALLADEAGLGKTYVALALAAEHRSAIVVAPAALEQMWRDAGRMTGTAARFVSVERLSRGGAPRARGASVAGPGANRQELVIVDEAQHLRNPGTRRYRALAELTATSRVLLLSATPVHNRQSDLSALLAFFLGERAHTLPEREIARCIVRRERGSVAAAVRLPIVSAPERISIADDAETLARILALPPAVPPSDGGDGGVLVTYTLVRQWASSRGALLRALRRRVARAIALLAAVSAGRHPSSAELATWRAVDGELQLAFPEIASDSVAGTGVLRALARSISEHRDAASDLLHWLRTRADPDLERRDHIRALRERYPGERIVAFSQFADTIDSLFTLLAPDGGVASLTAHGARIVSGRISRREALAAFAPIASGVHPPRDAERVDMLLATDLLSEGVNLQDASVVVHLDLPWTPARLEQRVGRLARLGSTHRSVSVYSFAPPAASEVMLEVERRLRAKLAVAARAIGVSGAILPSLAIEPESRPGAGVGAAECGEQIRALLEGWLASRGEADANGRARATLNRRAEAPPYAISVGAVAASQSGFVALLAGGSGPRLVASLGGAPTDDPAALLRALAMCQGDDIAVEAAARDDALACVGRWIATRAGANAAGIATAPSARARRTVITRIASITARTPAHRRPLLAILAAGARQAALVPAGTGAERVLGEMATAAMPDEAWLRAVAAFGALHGGPHSAAEGEAEVVALMLFGTPPGGVR